MATAARSQQNSSPTPVPASPASLDDAYKSAIQPVVDNNMRTDILGPHFCKILENHTPASKAIVELITKAITTDPDLKEAVKNVIKDNNKETKVQWIDRGIGAIGVIVIAIIIWGIEHLITAQTIVTPH